LLPALIQWQKGRRGTAFYTEASINLADDSELMRLMVEAGFNQVFVGIETPQEAGLAECNKRQNQKRNLIADVKRIQRAGLEVQGGVHHWIRQRHAHDFCAADRVHPEKRHCHGDGRPAASRTRYQASPAAKRRGAPDWPNNRQQPGWNNELHSADEAGNVVRRLQETHEIPLRARTLLPEDPHVPARIPASEIVLLVELVEFHGIPSGQPPSRYLWSRAFPILGFAALDIRPP